MADFDELLGALLTSLTQARRLADEEAIATAEAYKSHPLLEGMTIPRVRVRELILELPFIIEAHKSAEPPEMYSKAEIRKRLLERLKASAQENAVDLPTKFQNNFSLNVEKLIEKFSIEKDRQVRERVYEEEFELAIDKAIVKSIEQTPEVSGQVDHLIAVCRDLRESAVKDAFKSKGKPPKMSATIITGEVKERADSVNVARLRLVLREEGLEWSVDETSDGTIRRSLTPE